MPFVWALEKGKKAEHSHDKQIPGKRNFFKCIRHRICDLICLMGCNLIPLAKPSNIYRNDHIQNYIHKHIRQKLKLLHLLTDPFRKEIFPHSSEYLQGYYIHICSRSPIFTLQCIS